MDKSLVARFELKEVDEDAQTFSGLAATWDLDLGGDVINKGAFKRTLKNWKSSKRPLPLLDSHNGDMSVRNVVGKMIEATETDAGLEASFEMIDGPDGVEVFRRVKGQYVDGLSIGYQAVKVQYPETEEERQKGIYRYLDEVKLHEVSVVLFPMNLNARIDTTSMKAMLMGLGHGDRKLEAEEVTELSALHKHISDMLAGVAAPPAPQEEGPTPEKLKDLNGRIEAIMANRLATRISSVQHSSAQLIAGL